MEIHHLPQELEYSCLPACVRMVLGFYGHPVSESELRILFKTRPGGTSPLRVISGLSALGFEAQLLEGSLSLLQALIREEKPCIAHVWTPAFPYWKVDAIHAVVISGIDETGIWIHDPALESGPNQVDWDEFARAWSAVDHLLYTIAPI